MNTTAGVENRVIYRFEELDVPLAVSNHEILTTDRGELGPAISLEPSNGLPSRYLDDDSTQGKRRRFDWTFGIFLPLICFYFDPIVFRSESWIEPAAHSSAWLGEYKTIAYIFCFLSIMTLAASLLWGTRLRSLNAAVAGVLLASSIAAFVVGLLILPLSLAGLFVLIGALGFTPFFTGVVFARNARTALHQAAIFVDKQTLFYVAAISGIAAFVIPYIFGR